MALHGSRSDCGPTPDGPRDEAQPVREGGDSGDCGDASVEAVVVTVDGEKEMQDMSENKDAHTDTTQPEDDSTLVGKLIGSILSSPIYTTFTFVVLSQSLITRTPVNPAEWQTQIQNKYWLVGLGVFVYFLALMSIGFATDADSTLSDAIVVTFVSSLIALHLTTLDYASQRPELCRIHHLLHDTKVKWTWRSLLSVASVAVEFAQFISIAFLESKHWVDGGDDGDTPKFLSIAQSVARIATDETVLFSCVMAFAVAWMLLTGAFVAWKWTATHALAPVLFEFMAGALYLTVLSRTFAVAHRTSSSSRRGFCLFAGLFYASTAVFVSVYRGDEGTPRSGAVKYVPRFLVLERLLKGAVALTLAFTDSFTVYAAVVLPVIVCLILSLLVAKPCNRQSIIYARCVLLSCAGWTMVCATAVAVDWVAGPPLLLWIGGIVPLVVIPVLVYLFGTNCVRKRVRGRLARRLSRRHSMATTLKQEWEKSPNNPSTVSSSSSSSCCCCPTKGDDTRFTHESPLYEGGVARKSQSTRCSRVDGLRQSTGSKATPESHVLVPATTDGGAAAAVRVAVDHTATPSGGEAL